MQRLCFFVTVFVFGISATVSGISVAASDPILDAVINDLAPEKRIRIWTNGSQVFQGYFIRADGDSLYLGLSPGNASIEQNHFGGSSPVRKAIYLSEIDRMCTIDHHGIGRGLQWAGGVLLVGGALAFGAGADTLDEGSYLVGIGVTIGAAFYALYRGTTGTKETEVYIRD